jgi:hypothetical protein
MQSVTKLSQEDFDVVCTTRCLTGTQMALVCGHIITTTVSFTKCDVIVLTQYLIARVPLVMSYIKNADVYPNKFLGLWLSCKL